MGDQFQGTRLYKAAKPVIDKSPPTKENRKNATQQMRRAKRRRAAEKKLQEKYGV